MPYTAQNKRKELDPLINALAEKIVSQTKESGEQTSFAGMLNYPCTRLAMRIIRLQFGEVRYWMIAVLTGVFKNIADEMYRRVGMPYEEEQIKKNGDVDEYEKIIESIKD